jgi:poly-beta-1,6-N-acetyl-D-glucosamine synthase
VKARTTEMPETAIPRYSIVITTYRRPDHLVGCLESVAALDYPQDRLEVLVVDNGGPAANSSQAADPFRTRLNLRYLVNDVDRGLGFSLNRGMLESRGANIMLLNDDARLTSPFFTICDELLAGDPLIGCVGCRVIEEGYENVGDGIGRIDESGRVVGNFNIDCGAPIEVEHIYGFCYVFTREALRRAGLNDQILLAKRYSTGNRIETDHCLSIRRSGLKVVYHPRMVGIHLATPRPDVSEVSLRWKRSNIRNTIYLYLKHFGPFGKRGAALRLTFLVDVGVLSMLRRPSSANIAYFANGLRARASAYGHYLLYLLSMLRSKHGVSAPPARLTDATNP